MARLLLRLAVRALRGDRLGHLLEARAQAVERVAPGSPRSLPPAARRWSFRAYIRAGSVSGTPRSVRLRALDRIPVLLHLGRRLGLGRQGGDRLAAALEHVRMAADQLVGDVTGNRREVTLAALLQQQREEVDLEQDVAELVDQLRVVARVSRVGELVGLLDGVRHDAALVLLAIPRALAPQPPRHLVQRQQRLTAPQAPRPTSSAGGLR